MNFTIYPVSDDQSHPYGPDDKWLKQSWNTNDAIKGSFNLDFSIQLGALNKIHAGADSIRVRLTKDSDSSQASALGPNLDHVDFTLDLNGSGWKKFQGHAVYVGTEPGQYPTYVGLGSPKTENTNGDDPMFYTATFLVWDTTAGLMTDPDGAGPLPPVHMPDFNGGYTLSLEEVDGVSVGHTRPNPDPSASPILVAPEWTGDTTKFPRTSDTTSGATLPIVRHPEIGSAQGYTYAATSYGFKVGNPYKEWSKDTGISGVALVKPAPVPGQVTSLPVPVSLEQNATLDLEVAAAADSDHWTKSDEPTVTGSAADTIKYHWTAAPDFLGTFDDADSRTPKWTAAPLVDGVDSQEVTLTATVDDAPDAMDVNDNGSRDDDAVLRTIKVTVKRPVWNADPRIGQHRVTSGPDTGQLMPDGRMISPQDQRVPFDAQVVKSVDPGERIPCEIEEATDLDTLTAVDTTTTEAVDEVNYEWKAVGNGGSNAHGQWEWQVEENGHTVTKVGPVAPVKIATWIAPSASETTNYTLQCTVGDKPGTPNSPTEGGSRNDESVIRSTKVRVKSAVASATNSYLAWHIFPHGEDEQWLNKSWDENQSVAGTLDVQFVVNVGALCKIHPGADTVRIRIQKVTEPGDTAPSSAEDHVDYILDLNDAHWKKWKRTYVEGDTTEEIPDPVAQPDGSPKEENTTTDQAFAYAKTVVAWDTSQTLSNDPDGDGPLPMTTMSATMGKYVLSLQEIDGHNGEPAQYLDDNTTLPIVGSPNGPPKVPFCKKTGTGQWAADPKGIDDLGLIRAQQIKSLQYSVDLKYAEDPDKVWINVPQDGEAGFPLTLIQGENMWFRAVKTVPDSPWPDGMPIWTASWDGSEKDLAAIADSTAEADSGDERGYINATFNHASQDDSDLQQVKATCGNTEIAKLKVIKGYEISLSIAENAEDHLLVDGQDDRAETTLNVQYSDLDGNPVANAKALLTSNYVDDNGEPTTSQAGIIEGDSVSVLNGKSIVTMDSQGKATIKLSARFSTGDNPKWYIGTAAVEAKPCDDIGTPQILPLDEWPVLVKFQPPTAFVTNSDWVLDGGLSGGSGIYGAEHYLSLSYDDEAVVDRSVKFTITGIYKVVDGEEVKVIDDTPDSTPGADKLSNWVAINSGADSTLSKDVMTDSAGQAQVEMLWIKSGEQPSNYRIYYKVDDNDIAPSPDDSQEENN